MDPRSIEIDARKDKIKLYKSIKRTKRSSKNDDIMRYPTEPLQPKRISDELHFASELTDEFIANLRIANRNEPGVRIRRLSKLLIFLRL